MRIVTNEEFAKALKSGDFDQGPGYLEKDGANCCLGVLCNLAQLDPHFFHDRTYFGSDIIEDDFVFDGFYDPVNDIHYQNTELYDPIYHTFVSDPKPGWGDQDLAELNDSGYTFDDIADAITNYDNYDEFIRSRQND